MAWWKEHLHLLLWWKVLLVSKHQGRVSCEINDLTTACFFFKSQIYVAQIRQINKQITKSILVMHPNASLGRFMRVNLPELEKAGWSNFYKTSPERSGAYIRKMSHPPETCISRGLYTKLKVSRPTFRENNHVWTLRIKRVTFPRHEKGAVIP